MHYFFSCFSIPNISQRLFIWISNFKIGISSMIWTNIAPLGDKTVLISAVKHLEYSFICLLSPLRFFLKYKAILFWIYHQLNFYIYKFIFNYICHSFEVSFKKWNGSNEGFTSNNPSYIFCNLAALWMSVAFVST